jgi:hypothetical protein
MIQLQGHDITFDEYLLLKEIHVYENRNEEVLKSLEDKGFVKDNKVVDDSKLHEIEHALHDYFTTEKAPQEVFKDNNLLRLLALSILYKGGRFY